MKKLFTPYFLTLIFLTGITVNVSAQPWYVDTNGSDSNNGTLQNPFKTIEKAVSVVQAGQTILSKGGTYNLTSTITITKSGTAGSVNFDGCLSGPTPLCLTFSNPGFWKQGYQTYRKLLAYKGDRYNRRRRQRP